MNFREVYKGVAFRLSLRLWMCVGVGLCSIVSHSLWELWQVFAAAMCVCVCAAAMLDCARYVWAGRIVGLLVVLRVFSSVWLFSRGR